MTTESFVKQLNLLGGVIGFMAALLWLLASQVQPEPTYGADVVEDLSDAQRFASSWKKSAKLNMWASVLTGISISLTSLSAVLSQ